SSGSPVATMPTSSSSSTSFSSGIAKSFSLSRRPRGDMGPCHPSTTPRGQWRETPLVRRGGSLPAAGAACKLRLVKAVALPVVVMALLVGCREEPSPFVLELELRNPTDLTYEGSGGVSGAGVE